MTKAKDGERGRLLGQMFGDDGEPGWMKGPLMRSGEVAALFQVTRRTVNHWARAGKIASVVMPGGQRRFPSAAVAELLSSMESASKNEEATI